MSTCKKLTKSLESSLTTLEARTVTSELPSNWKKEKHLFMEVPLVESGDRFPFYEDYMASIGGVTNPDDLRTSTLISLIGTFVPKDGNSSLLESLGKNWTIHQPPGSTSSFGSGSATLTVSISSF